MTTRVLLLDDDDTTRLALAALLEAQAFLVVQASSVAEARQSLASAHVFDLALLDQHLGDGLQVDLIPALRAQLPHCKVIVVSDQRPGQLTTEDADAFFRKGQDLDELFATIHSLLAATPASGASQR